VRRIISTKKKSNKGLDDLRERVKLGTRQREEAPGKGLNNARMAAGV
jgi:hypothetical protein